MVAPWYSLSLSHPDSEHPYSTRQNSSYPQGTSPTYINHHENIQTGFEVDAFMDQMPFLSPNQPCQIDKGGSKNTEGKCKSDNPLSRTREKISLQLMSEDTETKSWGVGSWRLSWSNFSNSHFRNIKHFTYTILLYARQFITKPASLGWLHITEHNSVINYLI